MGRLMTPHSEDRLCAWAGGAVCTREPRCPSRAEALGGAYESGVIGNFKFSLWVLETESRTSGRAAKTLNL